MLRASDIPDDIRNAVRAAGIEVRFAELKGRTKDKLKRFGLFARFGEETFFPTVGAAVSSYLETHPVDCADSEIPKSMKQTL